MKRRMALLMSIILVISCINISKKKVNADSDTTAPVINSVSFDQSSVHAGDPISITMVVEDESSIKLDNSSYVIIALGNDILIPVYFTEQVGDSIYGSVETDSSWSNGGYRVVFVRIEDEFGNVNDKYSIVENMVSLFGGAKEDKELIINSLEIDKNEVSNGDTVTFVLLCKNMSISDPSYPKLVLVNSMYSLIEKEVNLILQEDGSYIGSITIDDTWFEGDYYIDRLIARNKNRRNVEYTDYQNYTFNVTGVSGYCDHSVVDLIALNDATCTEDGLGYKQCKACGYIVENDVIIEAHHIEVKDVAVKETCTQVGYTEGSHCSVCGNILTEQTEIPALGHSEEVIPAIEATCTKAGKTAGKKCSVCGKILVPQEIVSAFGHTVVKDDAVPATCTQPGITKGSHCSVCGTVFVAQSVIPEKGHTTVIVDPAVIPIGTTNGLTEGSHCSSCGEIFVAQEVIDVNVCSEGNGRHSWNYSKQIEKPTCENDGIDEYRCSKCGITKHEKKLSTGHTWKEDTSARQNATCTSIGEKKMYCSICGEIKYEDIPALGHNYKYDSTIKESTCTQQGQKRYICTRCSLYTYENTPANGHNYSSYERTIKEATCTEKGIRGRQCYNCDAYIGEEIPAKGHRYEEYFYSSVVRKPTCTQKGIRRYDCWDCDYFKYEEIPATGHDFNEWTAKTIKQATCTEAGLESNGCIHCGNTITYSVPATGHKIIHGSKVLPTNNSVGYTEGDYCGRCGMAVKGHQVIAKTVFTSEWYRGKWYDSKGRLLENSSISWHCDSNGWWYTNEKNWYPQDQWNKIDGVWYYFKPDGYMAQNEWYDGYWFGSNGAWTYKPTLEWHRDSHGWWVQDTSGWYPTNQWQKIDGVWRYFNGSGYMAVNQYVDGYWLGIDGRYY